VAERWIDETHQQLTAAQGADLEPDRAGAAVRAASRICWTRTRVEANLRTVAEEIAAELPAGVVSAADHSVAAGRDVSITAAAAGSPRGRSTGTWRPRARAR
jgi:hypothetical protein